MNDRPKGDAKLLPWLTVERLGAVTDGIIAIIVTILVLEITVPEDHDVGADGVIALMGRMSHDIMVYLLSFALIWAYWLQHHAIFHFIARTDRVLVFLNGLFLFLLSLSPFATKLASAYRGVGFAESVFGINLLLSGMMLLAMWRYAVAKKYLLRKPVTVAVVRSMSRRIMIAPAVILLGLAVSAVDYRAGAIVYFCVPLFYLKHWLIDTSWQEKE